MRRHALLGSLCVITFALANVAAVAVAQADDGPILPEIDSLQEPGRLALPFKDDGSSNHPNRPIISAPNNVAPYSGPPINTAPQGAHGRPKESVLQSHPQSRTTRNGTSQGLGQRAQLFRQGAPAPRRTMLGDRNSAKQPYGIPLQGSNAHPDLGVDQSGLKPNTDRRIWPEGLRRSTSGGGRSDRVISPDHRAMELNRLQQKGAVGAQSRGRGLTLRSPSGSIRSAQAKRGSAPQRDLEEAPSWPSR